MYTILYRSGLQKSLKHHSRSVTGYEKMNTDVNDDLNHLSGTENEGVGTGANGVRLSLDSR
jgi:hypothetical protein